MLILDSGLAIGALELLVIGFDAGIDDRDVLSLDRKSTV